MARIGFIGLGNMGTPMASHLVKAGHEVQGFDLSADMRAHAAARGVKAAGTARDAVAEAEIVVTMLPAGPHVLSVWSDTLDAAPTGALFIDSSTIDVVSARKAHEMAAGAGKRSIDAPVSGGVGGAEAGSLTFMCGGTSDAFAAALPYLEIMGGRIIHCGDAGAGQVAKLCNNMTLAVAMIGTAEAMTMGQKLGLSAQTLYDVMSTSSGQTWALTHHCPVPGPVAASAANRDFKPGFAADLMVKDLTLAQEAARSAGAATPMGALAQHLFRMFVSAGNGSKDYAAIIRMIEGKS